MFWEIYSELCKSQNTTPSAVAKAIGLSNAIPTKWKNGALPKGEILLKLSDHFDCSIDYLLTGKEKSLSTELTEDKQKLLYMYDLLNDFEKGEILGELKIITKDRHKEESAV